MPQSVVVDDAVLIDCIADALCTTGYIVLPDALPREMVDQLFAHFRSLDESRFQAAGIGRDLQHQVNPFVRADEIHWLDPATPSVGAYFAWIEALRLGLNRRLFLGLFDYECHYAWYPRGGFYRKHLDAFKGQARSRVVSTVLYLNPQWNPGDGGELLIYDRDGAEVVQQVEPLYGRCVVFLSEEFPHEVAATQRARFSLTGWFRVNSSSAAGVDPPR